MPARRVKNTTAKAGTTAADRKVLDTVSTTTSAPSAATDGYLCELNEFIHLLFAVGGTSPVFRVRIWWYSFISGQWHAGKQVVVNNDDIVTVEAQGLNRIYLQVETTPSGTSPTLDAWIALVRPV
jgi:hypothetical protein